MPERARARHLAPPTTAPSPLALLTAPLSAAAGHLAQRSAGTPRADVQLGPVRLAGIALVASSSLIAAVAAPASATAATPRHPHHPGTTRPATHPATHQHTTHQHHTTHHAPTHHGTSVHHHARQGAITAPAAHHRHHVVEAGHTAAAALAVASRYLGVPYRWGGTTPRGFDCSGFTQYVYRQLGRELPRTVAEQRAVTRHVPRSQARPGDLVFFGTSHLGIYVGANLMIDAPHSGRSVTVREIYSANVHFGRV